MFLRPLTYALLFVCFNLPAQAFDACATKDAYDYKPIAERYQKGLLFRIEKCKAPVSYIFGTYHSDNPQSVKNATPAALKLEAVTDAAFEYLEPKDSAEIVQKFMYYKPGEQMNLQKAIGDYFFSMLLKATEGNKTFTPKTLLYMRPWAAAIILQMPAPMADGLILDDRFKQLAVKMEKQLHGIETMEEQFNVFATLPEADQVTLLVDTIAELAQVKSVGKQLEAAYLAQDLTAISKLADESFAITSNAELKEAMIKRLLLSRNDSMTSRLLPLFENKATFAAVGALHLPGERGILKQLEDRGFFIFAE